MAAHNLGWEWKQMRADAVCFDPKLIFFLTLA
jgi:hypothetical protein